MLLSYDHITLFENQRVDHLIALDHIASNEEKATINTLGFVPNWGSFTGIKILAPFIDNLNSSFINGIEVPITGFTVYRQKIGENIYNKIGDFDASVVSIIDHLISNRTEYKWIIFPKTANGMCIALDTGVIAPDWKSWSVTSMNEVSDNIYISDEVWTFIGGMGSPVAGSEMQQNLDITHHKTLSKFPKTSIGETNYISSGFSALLGNINSSTKKYEDSAKKLEDWETFASSGKPVLVKDIKGRIFITTLDSASSNYENATNYRPITINTTYTQIADIHNMSVHEFPTG